MSVVYVTPLVLRSVCLLFLLFLFLGIRGRAIHHLHYTSHGAVGGVFVCLCTYLCVCVCTVLFRLLCMWLNWAWMMMMVTTTMFIACLVKKKKIACVAEHEIWQSVHWLLPPICCTSQSHPVFKFTLVGPVSESVTLLCIKTLSCG